MSQRAKNGGMPTQPYGYNPHEQQLPLTPAEIIALQRHERAPTTQTVLWYMACVQAAIMGIGILAVCAIQMTMPSALGSSYLLAPIMAYMGVYFALVWVPDAVVREGARFRFDPELVALIFRAPTFYTFRTYAAWVAMLFGAVYLVVQSLFYARCPSVVTPALIDTCTNGHGVLIATLVYASVTTALQLAIAVTETIIAWA